VSHHRARSPQYQGVALRQEEPIFRYLDTVGDGSGNKVATGDYSGAVEDFILAPPAGVVYYVARMLVSIEDVNIDAIDIYGGLAAALTNGISVLVLDGAGATTLDLTDGLPVHQNGDWQRMCYDVSIQNQTGNSTDGLYVRWTFTRSNGIIRLNGSENESFVVRLNDPLTGLISHTFHMHGFERLLGEDR
jgi:hypothetical protein